MKIWNTCWLVGAAVLLFSYIYFVELREPNPAESSERVKLFPRLDPAAVTRVDVVRSNETIRAERVGEHWQLASPAYPAQSTGIESLLEALTHLERQSEIPAQEIISQSGGLSPFGLDPPRASLRLEAGTNLLQLQIGSKTLLGDRVYVQPLHASGIYMTGASFLQFLPSSAAQWRDSRLMEPGQLAFDHIAVMAGTRSFELERDGTNPVWRLVKPLPTRADPGRVDYLIQRLRNARAAKFVSDDPKVDLEPFGLQTPEAAVTLSQGTNVVFQLQLGRSPTNNPALVHARCWAHSNVVLVSSELAGVLMRPYEFFRDQTLLSFRPGAIDRIEVQSREPFVVQRDSSERWRIVSPFQAPADPALMDLFLKDLSRLEILRFERDAVADFTPYGLANPVRRYLLQTVVTNALGTTNQTLVEADFGASPTNELDRVYCRRADESSVYVVKSFDMVHLPNAAFEVRDRRVWSFASNQVVRITILQGDEKRELARDPATGSWTKGDQVMDARIDETLYRLGALQVDIWAAQGETQARLLGTADGKHQLIFDVEQAGKIHQYSLSFGKPAGNGPPYASVVLEQGQPVIFRFPVSLWVYVSQNLSIPSVPSNP